MALVFEHVLSFLLRLSMTEPGGLLSSSPGTKKHLFVCFMQSPCSSNHMAYFLQSVSVDSLVPKSSPSEASETPLPNFEMQCRWVTELQCSHTGCISVGARLYFFGGQKPEDDDCPWNFSCCNLSKEVHCYYLPELVNFPLSLDASLSVPCIPESSPVQMKSEKYDPIVAEVGGYIYVLGITIVDDYFPIAVPSFEVYDPWENKWSNLPIPHHLHDEAWFHGWQRGRRAYVVVDKKICVSVANCSFAFDTGSGKWEVCKLFDCLDPFEAALCRPRDPVPLKRLRRSTRLSSKNDVRQCGHQFGFYGSGVLYDENILLGALPPYAPLVAYLLVDGKAERMQCFWLNLSAEDNQPKWASYAHIVDLGGGYFCYMYSTDEQSKSFVTLVTFKISRVGGRVQRSPRDEFLTCEVVGQKKDLETNWHLPCIPIRAFAM